MNRIAPNSVETLRPGLATSLQSAWRRATPLGWCVFAVACAGSGWATLSVWTPVAAGVYGVAFAALLVAAAIDVIEQRLPNMLTIGTAALGLVALPVITWATGNQGPWRAIAGGVIFGGWILAGALARRGAYGLGDVKLAVACGIYTAWLSWPTLAVAILTSQIAITATLIYGRLWGREHVPVGPAFVAGLIAAILLT